MKYLINLIFCLILLAVVGWGFSGSPNILYVLGGWVIGIIVFEVVQYYIRSKVYNTGIKG
jgi:hypothetical protein